MNNLKAKVMAKDKDLKKVLDDLKKSLLALEKIDPNGVFEKISSGKYSVVRTKDKGIDNGQSELFTN